MTKMIGSTNGLAEEMETDDVVKPVARFRPGEQSPIGCRAEEHWP